MDALAPASPPTIEAASAPNRVVIAGREHRSFAGCNYLALAHDPRVIRASKDAIDRFGCSTHASRRTSGDTTLARALEATLRALLGVAGAVVLPDGLTANLACAQALASPASPAGPRRTAVLDASSHPSLRDAAALAGLRVETYPHLDARAAASLARDDAVVMTDGVFAATGERAPIVDLLGLLPARTPLVIDDAHTLAGLSPRGSLASIEPPDPRVIITGSLAKGIGCGGGFAAGAAWLEPLVRATTTYVCTTPAPPASLAGATRAIEVMLDEPERADRLRANARALRRALRRVEPSLADSDVPFAGVAIDDARPELVRSLHDALREAGIFVPLVAYPGGPARSYLRPSVTSEHSKDDLLALDDAIRAWRGSIE